MAETRDGPFAGPHVDLWGLLGPDCGPQDREVIAAAAVAEVVKLREQLRETQSRLSFIHQYAGLMLGTPVKVSIEFVGSGGKEGEAREKEFVAAEQALIRNIGLRWGCPDYLTGELSGQNYAQAPDVASAVAEEVVQLRREAAAYKRAYEHARGLAGVTSVSVDLTPEQKVALEQAFAGGRFEGGVISLPDELQFEVGPGRTSTVVQKADDRPADEPHVREAPLR